MDSVVSQSFEVASQAFDAANNGKHFEAIRLFNNAIKLNSVDYRFFLNRSYCFFHIGSFQESLEDAERAIDLAISSGITVPPKAFFRKAMAFYKLDRLQEADRCFKQVLALDPSCPESLTYHQEITQRELDCGDQTKVEDWLEQCPDIFGTPQHSNKQLTPLTNGHTTAADPLQQKRPLGLRRRIFNEKILDHHSLPQVVAEARATANFLFDGSKPTNLLGLKGLRVGNLSASLKKQGIESFFGNYGEIKRLVKIKHERPDEVIVVVEYNNSKSPLTAFTDLRDKVFTDGTTLNQFKPLELRLIASKHQKDNNFTTVEGAREKVTSLGECFSWRERGCLDEECTLRHPRATLSIESHIL